LLKVQPDDILKLEMVFVAISLHDHSLTHDLVRANAFWVKCQKFKQLGFLIKAYLKEYRHEMSDT
jgi:hypothetical protein